MVAFWIPLFSGMTTCHRAAEKQSGKKLYNLKDDSLCRTHVYYCPHAYRKFRFATHAVKHSWTSSRPYCHECKYTKTADEHD